MPSLCWMRPTGRPSSPARTKVRIELEPRRVAERFKLRGCFFEFHGNIGYA